MRRTRELLSWSPSAGFVQETLARGVSLVQDVALAPIFPPSITTSNVGTIDAVRCPPVARGLGLYCSAMTRMDYQGEPQHIDWLQRTTGYPGYDRGPISPKLRDVRTLTDLILHNRALWIITRDSEGSPFEGAHVPVESWSFTPDGLLTIGARTLTPLEEAKETVVFHGAMVVPFLEAAAGTISHYRDLLNIIKDRSAHPHALQELKMLQDYDGLRPGEAGYDAEFDEILNAQTGYAAARNKPGGTVTVTPRGVDLKLHQDVTGGAMLTDARNAARLDVANHMNINAAMLDGNNGTSDTYSNTLQNVTEFSALSMSLYTMPITAALSALVGGPVSFSELDMAGDARGNTGQAVGTPQTGSTAGLSPGTPENP